MCRKKSINKKIIAVWNTPTQTVQWHITTQPNFITKPKPTHIDKISTYWTKPKPTKKPIAVEQSTGFQTLQDIPNEQDVIITKPKPQVNSLLFV